MPLTTLKAFSYEPLTIPLRRGFGIAGGVQEVARNVLIRVTLSDGSVGLGEAAPFPAASGETYESTELALSSVAEPLRACRDLAQFRAVSGLLTEVLRDAPAALAGVEIALFDALTRKYNTSLLRFFGGAETALTTDITIVTGSEEEAFADALFAVKEGFLRLKIKVGGGDLDADLRRVRRVFQVAPTRELIIDANGAYSSEEALEFLRGLGEAKRQVLLFEQPTPALDLEGLARVEANGRVRVLADESLRSREDFKRLVRVGGISAVNLKTAKLGVTAAWDLLLAAQALGLGVMVGGMVETELSMSTSACLAAGVGRVDYVDLDTPLFMGPRPLTGGYAQSGPVLDLTPIDFGHGVAAKEHQAKEQSERA